MSEIASPENQQIAVQFLHGYSKYNAGETALFQPDRAAQLVRSKIAAYEDPDMELPEITEAHVIVPQAQKDAQFRINRIAAICATLDQYNAKAWDERTGKPDVKYLGQLYGQSITEHERDVAFEQCQNQRKGKGVEPMGPKKVEGADTPSKTRR